MPVSEAKKKANARWNASKDNIMLRPTKEEGAAIRAAAAAAGLSNQQYILQATRERMEQDRRKGPLEALQGPSEGLEVSLPSEAYKCAVDASEAAGEGLPDFVARAVTIQAQRDEIGRKMKGGEANE